MIVLHRLNGSEIVINSRQIETVEGNPDTVILLTTERRYVVKESVQEVIDKVIEFNKKIVGRSGLD
jgi:flagellar protein FlbD